MGRAAWALPVTLELSDTSGEVCSIEDLRGRIVVVNFWATWCVPCRVEMPMLAALAREFAPRGIEVIGASADTEATQAQIAPLLHEAGVKFPIWLGATTEHMAVFQLGTALPATAIVDRDGEVLFRLQGPLREDDVRARLEWLLSDRAAPAPAASVTTDTAGSDTDHDDDHTGHAHAEGEEHQHGVVALEGASLVPS